VNENADPNEWEDAAPEDIIRYDTDPTMLDRVREALRSDRPIEVTWPGQVIEDVDGLPIGMTETRVIHPGQAETVPGDWVFTDDPDDPFPTISPCD
jgi:hypothetical protein